MKKIKIFIWVLLFISMIFSLAIAAFLGVVIANVNNADIDYYWNQEASIPSKVYDRNGDLITEFFSSEKREIIEYKNIPEHFIYTLIAREDRRFFEHKGFDIRGLARAALGVLTNRNLGGASTITQQVVGLIGLVDRREFSYIRKLKEIWYAIQLEKLKSKKEILEKYINLAFFGHNNYGANTASQFYFSHPLQDISLAESAILVIQLASPTLYSPINEPNNARGRQEVLMNYLVELGYISQEDSDRYVKEFWDSWDYTRSNSDNAFMQREDKAPYFSEYIRGHVQSLLGEAYDINEDGLEIYTTLDLSMQEKATNYMEEGIKKANNTYLSIDESRAEVALNFTPVVDLMALAFNIPEMDTLSEKTKRQADDYYYEELASTMEMINLFFTNDTEGAFRESTQKTIEWIADSNKKKQVEGALITLENETGYILTTVGGSGFQSSNQFNRAINARVQPGSAFKPLYYAAAIDRRIITPATVFNDNPVIFQYPNGETYQPLNYLGTWNGPIRVRDSLARSLNIPSIKILEALGFDDAIYYSARLTGLDPNNKEELQSRSFEPVFAFGLGIVSVSPLMIARAYSTIENHGRAVVPISIRYIKDRNGEIIFDNESIVKERQLREGAENQILSPQAAYITTNLMESGATIGTLAGSVARSGWNRRIDIAAKSGTTDNWTDAWAGGFSPYYTSVVWLGFDSGGKSLGIQQSGAAVAGPIWANFMKDIHEGLPTREFEMPDGIVVRMVNRETGLLASADSNNNIAEIFIAGTQPTEYHSDRFKDRVIDMGKTYRQQSSELDDFELDSEYQNLLNDILNGDSSSEEIDILENGTDLGTNKSFDNIFNNSQDQGDNSITGNNEIDDLWNDVMNKSFPAPPTTEEVEVPNNNGLEIPPSEEEEQSLEDYDYTQVYSEDDAVVEENLEEIIPEATDDSDELSEILNVLEAIENNKVEEEIITDESNTEEAPALVPPSE